MMIRIILFFIALCSFFGGNAVAQHIPPASGGNPAGEDDIRVGSYYTILPVLGYTSDQGFVAGGFLQRLNYGMNQRPFKNNLEADISFSTKGNIISEVMFEQLTTFGLPVRSRLNFIGGRLKESNYFGLGNNSEFSKHRFDDGYYYYEARELYFNYTGRVNLVEWDTGVFDAIGLLTFWRMNPISRGDETLLAAEAADSAPRWLNRLGAGVVADTRNNEFNPARGFYYDFRFETALDFLGSHYNNTLFKADIRHFFEPFRNVVLAHNFRLERMFGSDKPFWALPYIGGKEGVRGYHLKRFRGDSYVLNMLEIRSWLFSLFDGLISFGAQAFWDTGRVFSSTDSNAFFSGWKHGFGGGGAISLFSPDMILSGNIGFSEESFRIYFGAGYTF